MTEKHTQTVQPQAPYVAIIRIALPDQPDEITANVMLTPIDTIPTGSGYKPLHACTLADLQAFANTLEAEIWETLPEIKLVDLADDEATVELTILDSDGVKMKPSKEWFETVVVVGEKTETENNEPDSEISEDVLDGGEDEAIDQEASAPDAEPEATDLDIDESDADADEVTTAEPSLPEPEIKITILESMPVFEEPEATVSSSRIEPSQARVQVAGRRLRYGHPTWTAVDILMDEPALRAAQAHALSSMSREVAGVLIGPRPEKQPDGRYVVHVIDTIIAKHTVMQGASVTYTPESWRYMNDTLMERYPDETAVILGWYHTHPGFGIFLSGMDQFIHQNFFTQIWHIAYVLDPRARTSGFFCWDRKKTRVSPVDFAWPFWAPRTW